MRFKEWITEQTRINEATLPLRIKKLKTKIEKKVARTPLIVASDKGRVAVLSPDYSPIIDIGIAVDKFIVKTADAVLTNPCIETGHFNDNVNVAPSI